MDEIFPVLAGVVLGFVIVRMKSGWSRDATLVGVSLAIGLCASWVSGELAVSAWYALVDCAQVLAAAVMIAVLVKVWSRRVKRLT
jgi:hypothetical protein